MRQLSIALGILVFMFVSGSVHANSPDAWSAGGSSSALVAGCQGLGTMEKDLVDQIPGFLAPFQLDDPDLEGLRKVALAHMGLKGKRTFAQAFSLRPDGAITLHVIEKQGKPVDWVLAADVVNGQTFSASLTKTVKTLAAKAQKVAVEAKKEKLEETRKDAEERAKRAAETYQAHHGTTSLDCPDGWRDGGMKDCVPDGQCNPGFHDGGSGDCVPQGTCSGKYRLWISDGSCNKKKEPKVEPAVRVGRQQRLPGGAREVEICLAQGLAEDSPVVNPTSGGASPPRCYLIRVQGRMAFVAASAEALNAMAPDAVPAQSVSDLFRDGDKPGVGCLLRLRRREMNEAPVPWTPFVQALDLLFRTADDGAHTILDIHLGPAAAGQTPFLRPSEAGKTVRARMEELVRGGLSLWWRLGLDPQAAWKQMEQMIPPEGLTQIKKDWTGKTGLELDKDVVGVLSGDLMIACDGGPLDCVLMVGVRGEKGARAAIQKIQKTLERIVPKGKVAMKRLGRTGSTTHYRTSIKSGDKDGTKWEITWHWSLDDQLLYLSLFPAPIHALVEARPPETPRPLPPLLENQGFGDTALMASYGEMADPGALARQILAAARAWLPPGWWPGRLTRLVDMTIALGDQVVDQSGLVIRDGAHLRGEIHARMLPTEGQEGFVADLSARWTAAMATRYAGSVRASNRALAAIALEAPDTPWGRRAEACAMATSDILSSMLPMWIPALGSLDGPAFAGAGPEPLMEFFQTLNRLLGGAGK